MAIKIEWIKGPKEGQVKVKQFFADTRVGLTSSNEAATFARGTCELCALYSEPKTLRPNIAKMRAHQVITYGNHAGEDGCQLVGKELIL